MAKINRVGLGTYPLGGVFNPIFPAEAEKLVQEFIADGGYYIDTAPLYGSGEIERLLGRALKGVPRKNYYLITKTVKHVDKAGRVFMSGRHKDIVEQIDRSLSRLQTDYVDLLMIHSPDPEVPIEETLGAMEEVQKQGKAKELAVSNVNLGELKEYNKSNKIKFVQNRFSLINRSMSAEMQEYFIEQKIFLLPYRVLESGQLTGFVFENRKLKDGDVRRQMQCWNEENQGVIFEWVRNSLAPIARKLGITVGQLAIAWSLHQKFINFVIVGTTKPEYLKINLKADKIKLSPKILVEIENVYERLEQTVLKKYGRTMREFRGLNEKFY